MPTALITGVNRGIGLELFKQYGEAGWNTLGTCRSLAAAEEASAIAGAHDKVTLYELEMTDYEALSALADTLRGTAIDVLILNAGVMGKESMKLGDIEAPDFRRVLEVNVIAQALCLQAFTPHVAASERRVIAGMSSVLASIERSDGGRYSYRSSKAALNAIIVAASHDLRDQGIRTVALHPGWVQTDMGGPNATVTRADSAAGIRSVIDGLSEEDSGSFFSYAGERLPW
jgi:NAD(P)-dependent dehydrogenase (short-subunit alcohol dehydrogenase family)